jgi:flagellar biosynthetic protein FliP
MMRFSRPVPAFVGGMPACLRITKALGVSRLGPELALAPVRLKGPRLMWGDTLMAADAATVAERAAKAGRSPGQNAMAWLKKAAGSHLVLFCVLWAAMVLFLASPLIAQGFPSIKPSFVDKAESPEDVTSTIELMLLLTVLTLAPSILIMCTAFTRIIIVFGFLRMALSTQQLPPTQVLTGLALILTFLVMSPTIKEIKNEAIVPYLDAKITQHEAYDRSVNSLRNFMFAQVARKDLLMFGDLAGQKPAEWKTYGDIDTLTLIPAFVTSELKRGFFMGFMLYLPFLIIDLIVSTVLISMGMLVLPPVLISLPFKILLFVLVDGWTLVVRSLVNSFVKVHTGSG